MNIRRPALLSLTLIATAAVVCAAEPTVRLFNGRDLANWTTVVREGDTPDPGTWTIEDGVLKCSGRPSGYIRTKDSYRDFRLIVEWRWTGPDLPADSQGRPRLRNSGVLLRAQGPDTVWPKSLEAQLMQTNAGDIYVIGGVETAELTAARAQSIAAAGADAEAANRARNNRRVPKAGASSEKPVGEWNRYEITCSGDTVILVVNGVEQNRATGVTLREGHICLQSEGAPIEFRTVTVFPLN